MMHLIARSWFFLALLATCLLGTFQGVGAQGVSERVVSSTMSDFVKTIPATIVWVEGTTQTMESISQTGAPVEVEAPSTFSKLVASMHSQGGTNVKVMAVDLQSRIVTAETPSGKQVKLEVPADSLTLVQVGDTLALEQTLP